jgi:hypothetical protein
LHFQQKSAVDTILGDKSGLGDDKSFGGGGHDFGSFAAFVDPVAPIVSEKDLQSKKSRFEV